jgi:quinolinate synthase
MLIPLITEYEKAHISERQALPERYLGLSDEEMDRRIAAARATLGRRLVILGHHYQRDEVIKFADYTGDSFKLARQVGAHPDAEFIVFCGVHFMAESADVLSADRQQVILPDLAAAIDGTRRAGTARAGASRADGPCSIVPSPISTLPRPSATVNAGVVCTSSMRRPRSRGLARRRTVRFFRSAPWPQHRGALGVLDQMVV